MKANNFWNQEHQNTDYIKKFQPKELKEINYKKKTQKFSNLGSKMELKSFSNQIKEKLLKFKIMQKMQINKI